MQVPTAETSGYLSVKPSIRSPGSQGLGGNMVKIPQAGRDPSQKGAQMKKISRQICGR
jgi:hypothetical protein